MDGTVADYDVILYGLGIESLTIGSLLAKRGKRILILGVEGDSEDQPFLSRDGFLFDAYPSFWLAPDPERPHPVFSELGISIDFQPLDPGLQVVLPHHRLSFHREEGLFWAEIRREFPHQGERIAAFLRHMEELRERMGGFLRQEFAPPSRGLQEKWVRMKDIPFSIPSVLLREGKPSLSPCLRVLGKDREVSLMISSLLLGLGGVGARNCNALFASLLFSLLREPICYPAGGAKRIHEALQESFLKNGGELRFTLQDSRLIREKKRIRGLATAEGGEFLGKTIMGGPRLWRVYEGQKETSRPGKIPPLQGVLSVLLGVDQEVLPEEMGRNVLLVSSASLSSGGPGPIWITTSPCGGGAGAPQGKRALTATVFHAGGWEEGSQPPDRAKVIMGELEDFLPFLSQHLHFEGSHFCRSFSMLQPARRWGLKFRIAPLKQIGYSGLRVFSPQQNLLFIGDLPVYGIGLRARIDAGYYWASALGSSREG